MDFRRCRIQANSLRNRTLCFSGHLVRLNVARKHEYHEGINQSRMSQAKRGIMLCRLLEICYGFLRIEQIEFRIVITPAQIKVVRLWVPRSIPDELPSLFGHKLSLHLISDSSPDFTV